MKEFASQLLFESMIIEEAVYMWLSNVQQVLEQRAWRLMNSNKLDFSGCYNGKLFLVLLGDKGGRTTKIAIGIGNVAKANSANNLLLIALFDDDDDNTNLVNLKSLFHQLKFNSLVGREIVW